MMDIKAKIKTDMFSAMKAKDATTKDILQVVLGEISQREGRTGVSIPETEVFNLIRKIISSNDEVILHRTNSGHLVEVAKLKTENEILGGYLPVNLTVSQILESIPLSMIDEIKLSTPNNGKIIGKVMKYFKENNLSVSGDDVKESINFILTQSV